MFCYISAGVFHVYCTLLAFVVVIGKSPVMAYQEKVLCLIELFS